MVNVLKIHVFKIQMKLLWNRMKMAYQLRKLKAATATANMLLDRMRAKYPELFKEDE